MDVFHQTFIYGVLSQRSDASDAQLETEVCYGDHVAANYKAAEAMELSSLRLEETDDEEEEGEGGDLCEENPKTQVANVSKRKPEEPSSGTSLIATEPQPELKKKKLQQLEQAEGNQQKSETQEQKKSEKQPQQQQQAPKQQQQQQQQQQQAPKQTQKQSQKKQPQQTPWWRQKPRYFVQELVSHQDIILDVSIADGLIASASRDSQVKIWSLDSGALECTLSGHSEAAQACLMLPVAASVALAEALVVPPSSRLVVTGGGDSHLLLWRVDAGLRSATELRRIYMFTPITGLVRLDHEEGLVVAVGTSSGKIEVWNLLEKRLERSRQLHRSPVTCVRLVAGALAGAPALLSCAEAGDVALLRTTDLASVYVAGETSARRGVRHNAAVALGAERLLVADTGASLKLHRRGHHGMQRVANSRHEFGLCDALWSGGSRLVIASAFDVDFGRGYLNFHNFEDPVRPAYLMSLEPPQCTGRFLCLDAVPDPGVEFPKVVVSGGIDLLLWQRLPTSSDFAEAECSRVRVYRLFRPVAGQDFSDASGLSSEETSGTEEEEEAAAERAAGKNGQVVQRRSWWWCNLL